MARSAQLMKERAEIIVFHARGREKGPLLLMETSSRRDNFAFIDTVESTVPACHH
jgi:hypothetical protein